MAVLSQHFRAGSGRQTWAKSSKYWIRWAQWIFPGKAPRRGVKIAWALSATSCHLLVTDMAGVRRWTAGVRHKDTHHKAILISDEARPARPAQDTAHRWDIKMTTLGRQRGA